MYALTGPIFGCSIFDVHCYVWLKTIVGLPLGAKECKHGVQEEGGCIGAT